MIPLLLLLALADWQVCWTGPYTHDEYCGQAMRSKATAQAWVRHGNSQYPQLKHHIKRVKPTAAKGKRGKA